MILQKQAKVHGLENLGVSTYTYLSLSEFKATFCLSHSSRLVREVCSVVRWRAGWLGWFLDWLVGEFGWLAGFFTSSACSDSLLDSSAARACLLVGWLAGLLLS